MPPRSPRGIEPRARQRILMLAAATTLLVVTLAVHFHHPDGPHSGQSETSFGQPLLQVGQPRGSQPPQPPANRQKQPASSLTGQVPSGHLIRVNISPGSATLSAISVPDRWQLTPADSDRILAAGEQLAEASVVPGTSGIRIGDRDFPVGRLELRALSKQPSIWLNGHQYRGTVRIYRTSAKGLLFVNVLDIEDYIASVVDSEMPAAFPTAARQAQAIAARTYALYQQAVGGPDRLFDVYASTRSQKYLGFQYRTRNGRRLAGETTAGRQIARQTRGLVCLSRGRLFCTYYSAVCGGTTTNGRSVFADADPMLTARACRWCEEADLYRWERTVDRTDFDKAVRAIVGRQTRSWGRVQHVSTSTTSAEVRLTVSDGRNSAILSGTQLRQALAGINLPSPHFDVTLENDQVAIRGRGHGHGVGLCQWGARGQALAGRTTTDILRFYYPGARLTKLDYER